MKKGNDKRELFAEVLKMSTLNPMLNKTIVLENKTVGYNVCLHNNIVMRVGVCRPFQKHIS